MIVFLQLFYYQRQCLYFYYCLTWRRSRSHGLLVAVSRAGALGWWLAPMPFTPEFGVRFPVSAVWKKQKMFLPHPHVKVSIVGSLRDREVACSASDRQGSNFESCVWRTMSSHHPQEVLLAQFSLYVHKGGLKPELVAVSGKNRPACLHTA